MLDTAMKNWRSVKWEHGAVRYGFVTKADGTQMPRYHDSDVAAIGYAISNLLMEEGIFDENFNQIDFEDMVFIDDSVQGEELVEGTSRLDTLEEVAAALKLDGLGDLQSLIDSLDVSNVFVNVADLGIGEPISDEFKKTHSMEQLPGSKCPHCGANAVIKKDGCSFCTACGVEGSCG